MIAIIMSGQCKGRENMIRRKPQLWFRTFFSAYIHELNQSLDLLDSSLVHKVISVLMKAYRQQKTVYILGNGGSASNASHMACDLSKGTLTRVYDEHESRFKVLSLTDNAAIMTAFSNDLSYGDVFTQQLRNLVRKGDVVIALSASGNSKNVIKAITYAKRCGAITIGFLGFKSGGRAAKLVNYPLIVQSTKYSICEDVHLILNHIITSALAKQKQIHDRKETNP